MNKKIKFYIIVAVVLAAAVFLLVSFKGKKDSGEVIKEINPAMGTIEKIISTTGTVLPKNRLEIKPPVNGRVDSVMVQEGEKVKIGQTLAWMSSTDRAALLDAARAQGEAQLKYWQQVYKPIELLAPIDGEVIVATTQPGQTVTTSEAVVVLSDHLIVRAQVDETDIGKIKLGQKAVVSLDAYPDNEIKSSVEHIYYESQTVNNVTIYPVDLVPEQVPDFFRSGMNATVDFNVDNKANVLVLPLEAVRKDKNESYVLLKKNGDKEPVKQVIQLGISDDKNVEVVSGLSVNDKVMIMSKKYVLPTANSGSSPFMPFGQRRQGGGGR